MQPTIKAGTSQNCLFMSCSGTLECKQTILYFVEQRALARLRELLPVIFDKNKVYTSETRMRILRECSLTPIREGSQVTFSLPQRSRSSSPMPRSSSPPRPATPSVSERSWPSSVETESD